MPKDVVTMPSDARRAAVDVTVMNFVGSVETIPVTVCNAMFCKNGKKSCENLTGFVAVTASLLSSSSCHTANSSF